MIIDIHAHFMPSSFYHVTSKGKSWYGWQRVKDDKGHEYAIFDDKVSPLHKGLDILDPMKRIQSRIAEEGIDFEGLGIVGNQWNYHLDPKEGAALCREANQELADIEKAYPQHFRGMATLPMQDTKAALKEMEHAIKDLGLRSITFATNINGKNLDDPDILPILAAAAEAKVFVNVHPDIWSIAGQDRFPRYYFRNSFGSPLESSLAAMSVVYSGLLDRYPDLKISFRQGGGWVHYGVGRFALRYQQRDDARPMKQSPEKYLNKMYYDCLIHDSESLRFLVSRVGADHVMLGTDYPAGGGILGGTVKWIRGQSFLSEQDKEKILSGNAARLLGLPSAAKA